MYSLIIYIYIIHPHQTGNLCGHHSKTHGRIFSPIWSTSKCALGELGAVTCGCWDENFDKRHTPSTLRLQRRPWLWAEGIDVDGSPHWPLRTAWCEWDVPLSQSSNILVLHQTPSAYSIGIVNGDVTSYRGLLTPWNQTKTGYIVHCTTHTLVHNVPCVTWMSQGHSPRV